MIHCRVISLKKCILLAFMQEVRHRRTILNYYSICILTHSLAKKARMHSFSTNKLDVKRCKPTATKKKQTNPFYTVNLNS